MEKPTVRISVRNLVEFILRGGDLDNRRGNQDKEAMLKGSRLHRKIQRQQKGNYRAEVSLKMETEYEDVILCVEGRADGIFEEDEKVFIDEIKGIAGNVAQLEKPVEVHRAQAMCYGMIYAEQENLSHIGIQMTYANLETEEIRRFSDWLSRAELETWYRKLVNEYHKWISYQLLWRKKRNASMENLEFPFPYREGQRRMVTSVYHTISTGKQIFIQAPTGVGKTMSTIFPAVRCVGEEKGETIFYLTAKTITRTVAEEAFSILKERGLLFKVVTITAKEKLCICEKTECNPDNCPYARGHFDRVNEAVYELWTSGQSFDRDTLTSHADKWQVCPFEMSLDLAMWADGIICDYNYAFDPNVHLKRFFGDGVSGDYIFLIDEAHNLVERGREMYSAYICKEDVLETKKKVKPYSRKLARALERVNHQLLELKKSCDTYEIQESQGLLPLSLLNVQGEMDKLLEEPPEGNFAEEILDFYFQVRDFLNVSELVDENYTVYTENGEDGKFRLRLSCINPAVNLKEYLDKGKSTVFFSATLLPMQYYRKLLSTRNDDFGIYVESPFSREKRLILTCADVSSRYKRRDYSEYKKIAEYIARTVWKRPGNYIAFFPSYKLMQEVQQVYEEEFSVDWVRSISQVPEMHEREREEFLEEFSQNEGTLVGFCVLGGVFSEGIDLIGEKLIGAFIVGTGLPQIGSQREVLREYYDRKGENGFDYAYRYPGMNKVLQAAGRVIRTAEDVGVILLMDERFLNREYQPLFPVEWEDRTFCRLSTVEDKLADFWRKNNCEKH